MVDNSSKNKGNKDFFSSLISDFADTVLAGVKDSKDALLESGQILSDFLTDSLQSILQSLDKTEEFVFDQINGGIGYVKDGIYYVGDKAMEGSVIVKDGVLMMGETVIGTLINTSKFLTDSEYREKVGIPWLKSVIEENQKILLYQMQQNRKTLDILFRYSMGDELKPDELKIATKQLLDMIKLVPALAIFLLPGGMLLLPLFAKMLPWELIPDLKPPEKKKSTTTPQQGKDNTDNSSSEEPKSDS